MNIRTLAAECYETCRSLDEAADLILAAIEGDIELREQFFKFGAHELARQAQHAVRSCYDIPTAVQAVTNRGLSAMIAVGNEKARLWMDYPLSCGVFLGDATKDQVLEESKMYKGFAAANGMRGRFMDAIAKAMGEAAVVREALDEEAIGRLRKEAATCAA